MENGHLPDDKLFRAVHDRLSDYEAPYDGADWDAMSRSLDKLPKTSRMQWKFSLNTLLIFAGIGGLSLLGYALTKPGSSQPAEKQNAPVPVTQTVSMQETALTSLTNNTTNNLPKDSNNGTVSNQFSQTNPDMQTLALNGSSSLRKKKEPVGTDLLFGDQIDKRKGFIYQTHEDPAVISNFQDTAVPNVYYDLDNGKVRPIVIHKDSSGLHAEKKSPVIDLDSLSKMNTHEGAPTNDGGPQKFEFKGNR